MMRVHLGAQHVWESLDFGWFHPHCCWFIDPVGIYMNFYINRLVFYIFVYVCIMIEVIHQCMATKQWEI